MQKTPEISPLDPRIHPWRKDRAAAYLRGRAPSPLYVEGIACQVRLGQAALRIAPENHARIGSEILFGETFIVYDKDTAPGWAWGQLKTDGYVGYCWLEALSEHVSPPTHKVGALGSFVYPAPDLKMPAYDCLSFGARVTVEEEEKQYARLAHGGWVHTRTLLPLDSVERDFVSVAERFMGVPYLWGGRTPRGIDCSSLVQLSLDAAGVECPRDADMQEKALGEPVPESSSLMRGDLVFSKGHVAIALDADTIIHANAFHMAVGAESLADFLARGNTLTSRRRLAASLPAMAQ